MREIVCCFICALTLGGCGLLPLNSSTNVRDEGGAASPMAPAAEDTCDRNSGSMASARVKPCHRGRTDTLMILSFSGGGSRAAYLSAKIMFALDDKDTDLLKEVDAISAVSGGALPAAYYSITEDTCDGVRCTKDVEQEGVKYRLWRETQVLRAMEKNYIRRWFGNWFWPQNIVRYWFTDFDRTDIMAKTFADNLFDRPGLRQKDYKIGQLNRERPHLILNATNATAGKAKEGEQDTLSGDDGDITQFGSPFRFTVEQFKDIDSDIQQYSLARAVMASASFPAVFNFMTLKNYKNDEYVHVFDGGASDNQGLDGVLNILKYSGCKKENADRDMDNCSYDKIVVILVDAYTGSGGVKASSSDGRSFTDFVVDTNFIDATDTLLHSNRDQRTSNFFSKFESYIPENGNGIYYHITLDDIEDIDVKENAQKVSTSFSLSGEDAKRLENAVGALMKSPNKCLKAIEKLLNGGGVPKQGGDTGNCRYLSHTDG